MTIDRWKAKKPEEREDWLMSYADMITLLMAFFVMLLSMSKIDTTKYEKVESGMAKDIGKRESQTPIENLKTEMTEVVKGLKLDEDKVAIGTDERGLVLEFDANTFFEQGSAKIKDDLLGDLVTMCATLNGPKYSAFQVEIEGHTDDNQVSNSIYPSNWELSAARASMVVRLFIQHGMAPTRLSALGLADTRPKVPNRDANGNPLAVNQGINRRVAAHIFPR